MSITKTREVFQPTKCPLRPKFISNLYTKLLPQNSYQESVRYTSVALCAVGTSVTLHNLRPLRDSVCLLYKTFSLSLHISEEPLA